MRCDQYMGLTEAAQSLISGESVRMEKSGKTYSGMFDDVFCLNRYTLQDGRVFTEAVQAEPWSSGPCFFLALQDEHGEWVPESLWSENEINAA